MENGVNQELKPQIPEWLFIGYNKDNKIEYQKRFYFYDTLKEEVSEYYDKEYGVGNWIILHEVDTPTKEILEVKTIANSKLVDADDNLIYLRNKEKIEIAIKSKIDEILKYDTSSSVNEFTIQGIPMWLSKNDRVSLIYAMDVEKSMGHTTISLWNNGTDYPLPIEDAKVMLSQLEWYAKQSYDNTQKNISSLKLLTKIEDINNFNITQGYPQKLNF